MRKKNQNTKTFQRLCDTDLNDELYQCDVLKITIQVKIVKVKMFAFREVDLVISVIEVLQREDGILCWLNKL